MSTSLEFKYRIIYESLSRFSSTLSRSMTLEEVRSCLQRQVKYLFDYQLIRFCFYQQEYVIVCSLTPVGSQIQSGGLDLMWAYEQQLLMDYVPVITEDQALISENIRQLSLQLPCTPSELWGWNNVFSADSGIIVSVYSGLDRQFQATDVPVLKITLENLYAKLLSIQLIDELGKSKKEIEQALLGVQEKNAVIARLVATQDEIIRSRTQELEEKNTKLLQLSRQHAHIIREPLTRILSLTYMVEILPADEVVTEILPLLVTTSTDLDTALQQVIKSIDSELGYPG
ncbi:hypothetical protein GGR92_003869 [Spirosoma lacussanchae]|uniref:hypothetical protein n=1 Tax=Spirosoma lacussanchae TaxID=1884249 RepID=UPI0011090E1C|nr:hypothetical protein [Spirosoma lacussanchae]